MTPTTALVTSTALAVRVVAARPVPAMVGKMAAGCGERRADGSAAPLFRDALGGDGESPALLPVKSAAGGGRRAEAVDGSAARGLRRRWRWQQREMAAPYEGVTNRRLGRLADAEPATVAMANGTGTGSAGARRRRRLRRPGGSVRESHRWQWRRRSTAMEWNGMENGMEWNGMEWNGQWNGPEWNERMMAAPESRRMVPSCGSWCRQPGR